MTNEENIKNTENQETMAENSQIDDSLNIEQIIEENTKLKEKLTRAQADYQNFVTRTERDRQDMAFFLTEKLLRGLLPQIDNLDRAMKIAEGKEGDAFVDGVRAVQSGIMKYLENHRVQAFDSVGQEVDPDRHEVLSQMPGEEGKIIQEFEKGYELDGRVLRHAKVVVGSGE